MNGRFVPSTWVDSDAVLGSVAGARSAAFTCAVVGGVAVVGGAAVVGVVRGSTQVRSAASVVVPVPMSQPNVADA